MMRELFLLKILLFSKYLVINSDDINSNIANYHQDEEKSALKSVTEMLSVQLEKWNDLFLTSLEPKMLSTATSLANIDSNIHNIQERAHVWDTLQLHVAAWNDQLASLDRKADIISKGQEKILAFEPKINAIGNLELKIESTLEKISSVENTVSELKQEFRSLHDHKNHDHLFDEFAGRGILSSLKAVEKKFDRFLSQHNTGMQFKSAARNSRLNIKCNTPRVVEELLSDIASKVDIIFDKISGKEENNDDDYGTEDYGDNGSGSNLEIEHMKVVKKRDIGGDDIGNINKNLVETLWKIENMSHVILDKQKANFEKFQQAFEKCSTSESTVHKILNDNLEQHKQYFESFLLNFEGNRTCLSNTTFYNKNEEESDTSVLKETEKSSCEDLNRSYKSGVYLFEKNTELNPKNRSYEKKYCEIRDNISWTVIQRRENQSQNFNLSWFDYKFGFGDLNGNFWFGNDFISKLSRDGDLILRIELEDFEGHTVWAEYKTFVILSEEHNYQLIIRGYRGNASDSFSSHNGSLFSTFDRKNDNAPECCPCAISYGGGWWFNSCFESNLNGIYYEKKDYSGHYKGIIWENWLGNYSLKKTVMMVRSLRRQIYETPTLWPYYEDP